MLEPGDAVACYTDGLIEGAKTPIEGERYLLDALQDAGAGQLDAIVDQILARGQLDDATIVRVSYRGPQSSWRFEVDDAGSAHSARAAFCDHLLRNGVDRETGTRAELVFGELVGNVVRHAPGPIEINLSFLDDEPVLSVRDRGPGFARHENPLPEPFAESGRGLFLVEAYAGSAPVILRRRRGGTKVVATIHPAVAAAMLSPRA